MKPKWIILVIIFFLCIVATFEFKAYFERSDFFDRKINASIKNKKGNWTFGRSEDCVTSDKFVITLVKSSSKLLETGDSISKESKTWRFNLYRKNINGGYYFLKTYLYTDNVLK